MASDWVSGYGNVLSPIAVVGEAPAIEEMRQGIPFVGRTGAEVDNYLIRVLHVHRESIYATNIFKYELNEKKEYTDEEWDMMCSILEEELASISARIIISLGAVSTKFFIHDFPDMESVNAIPHVWVNPYNGASYTVIPSFHPAAAFHESSIMQFVIEAFEMAREVWGGRGPDPHDPRFIKDLTFTISSFSSILPTNPRPGTILGLDTEAYKSGSPYMVQGSTDGKVASYLYCDTVPGGRDIHLLSDFVDHPNVLTVFHNAPYDLPIVNDLGIFPRRFTDTMQMAFLLQTLPMGLKALAYRLLKVRMREYEEVVGELPDLSHVKEEERLQYACGDPIATVLVFHILKSLAYDGMEDVLERDVDIIPMICAMMRRGIKANREYFGKMRGELEVRNMELVESMIEKFPIVQNVAKTKTTKKLGTVRIEDFNPGSDKQVAQLLYGIFNLGRGLRIKKSKWGGSVNKQTMVKLQDRHPIVPMIQDYRETSTLIDDFLCTLPDRVKEDGRIHTKISLIRVKHSGRLASSNPNLMAQPVRSADGRRIRDGFEATPGFVIVSIDYNQIEMRLMADLSQDKIMCDAYRKGKDIHTETAMRSFGIAKPEDVDEMKHRYPAKRVGFGVINDISAAGLSRELIAGGAGDWPEHACQELLDSWFFIYKGVKAYMDAAKTYARRFHKTVDMWGRMEYIPQVISVYDNIRAEGLRVAINQRIQSGAQGIIKEAMRQIWKMEGKVWVSEDVAYPLIQIHDDIVSEVRIEHMDTVIPIMQSIMENAVKLSIPVKAEPKVGVTWGRLKKWKKGERTWEKE